MPTTGKEKFSARRFRVSFERLLISSKLLADFTQSHSQACFARKAFSPFSRKKFFSSSCDRLRILGFWVVFTTAKVRKHAASLGIFTVFGSVVRGGCKVFAHTAPLFEEERYVGISSLF